MVYSTSVFFSSFSQDLPSRLIYKKVSFSSFIENVNGCKYTKRFLNKCKKRSSPSVNLFDELNLVSFTEGPDTSYHHRYLPTL